VILKLIGNDAAFMGRLDRMEDDKLRLAELHQKLVAVDDDAGRDFLFPDGFAKKASELKGVTAQYKHKDAFNFTLQVVMLVMANHWVTLRDLSRGMQTRAQVVKFPRSFLRPDEVEPDHPDIQRPEYWDKVFKEEMSGVLNCLIAGFYRLKNRGSFDQPKSCIYARDEWFQNANTVARFVSEGCKRNSNSAVDLREFRQAYSRWCEDEGIQPRYVVSKNMIKKHITDLGYEVSGRNGYPRAKGLEVTYEPMGWTRFAK
jgi:phage/plasmid-associated DNA primase